METLKMTADERKLLDDLDQYLAKVKTPPEIPLYRFQAVLFKSICQKIDQGMPRGKVNPDAKTYRGVPIRCRS